MKSAHEHETRVAADECNCEFDPYENDDEESWHYKRTCSACGGVWWSLHCPHDGHQNPCSHCGVASLPFGVASGMRRSQ